MRKTRQEFDEFNHRLKLWFGLPFLGAGVGAVGFICFFIQQLGSPSMNLIQLFNIVCIIFPLAYFHYSTAVGAAAGALAAFLLTKSKKDAGGSIERPGMRQS